MDQSKIPSGLNDFSVCDAFNCYENAVQEINVKVGTLGFIKLMVCSRCKEKFVANTAETRETPSQDEVGA
jgi:hypothetical protein